MADSPHQLESLADEITRLKADLKRKEELRDTIERLGHASAGGGTSTTYPPLKDVEAGIAWLRAQITAKTRQLIGEEDPPGVNYSCHNSGYNVPG